MVVQSPSPSRSAGPSLSREGRGDITVPLAPAPSPPAGEGWGEGVHMTRHSREGGNLELGPSRLDPRLRGDDAFGDTLR